MWNKGKQGQIFLQNAINDFEKQTGVKVNVQWKGRGPLTKLLPSLNTSNVPADMVEDGVQAIADNLGATGNAVDLTSTYNTKVPNDSQTVAQVVGPQFEKQAQIVEPDGSLGAPVAVPYLAGSYAFFYNGKTFPQLVSNPPTTWAAFTQILAQRKASGVNPLALDGSISGYSSYYFQYLSMAETSADEWYHALGDKTGQTWLQPGFLAAAEKVEQLVKASYFIKGYNDSKYPAMEDKWANNDSDFILMGTWIPGEVASVQAPGYDYQAFPFPSVDGKTAPPLVIDSDGLGIVKKSKHVAAAQQFVAWLLQSKYQAEVGSMTQNVPVRKGVAVPSVLGSIKTSIDAGNAYADRMTAADNSYVNEVLFPVDDNLINGKTTAQQFVEKLASASATYWAAKK